VTALAGLLLIVGGACGPDGYAVHRRLLAPAGAFADLLAAADGSWVVWHHHRDWARAFYSPPEEDVRALAVTSAGAVERLLPGLRVPRIFLYVPTYRPGGTSSTGSAALSEQAVDVAEHYFHALVELYLDRRLREPGSWFRRLAEARAAELMDEVPPAGRLPAYADAAADFAAHLLSIAHEIGRADRRAAARGTDLCGLLDPPRTLFALWRRSIRSGVYRGRYRPAFEPGAGATAAVESRRGLGEEDKRRILDELLHGWTGDPARDFAGLCRPPAGG
jgi:hypothetical protein